MPNVLITNVYSYKNKGDAAIVLVLVDEVKRLLKPSKIIIQTADSINDQDKYPVDELGCTLLWILLSSARNKSFFGKIWHILSNFLRIIFFIATYLLTKKKIYWLISKDLQVYFKQIIQADIVIACGGGYLRTADSSIHGTILLFITGLNFFIPRFFGKKVFLYSQYVGPIHGLIQKHILIFFLSHVQLIFIREDISFNLLKRLNIDTPFFRVSDPVFILRKYETITSNFSLGNQLSSKLNIGVTVRNWFKSPKKQEVYEKAIASFLDYLHTEYEAKAFYFPQVIAAEFGDDDRTSVSRVKKYTKYADSITVIDDDLHPNDLINFAKEMDIFLGTRMHSNIFSLIANTPVIAIEYEHKSRGIMQDFNMEEFVIPIDKVNLNILISTFCTAFENQKLLKNRINENFPFILKNSEMAMEIIKRFI